MPERVDELIAELAGWSRYGTPSREGDSWRCQIRNDADDTALLYIYDDPIFAERVWRCRQEDMTAQLFIVEEPLERGDDWLIVSRPTGKTAREIFRGNHPAGKLDLDDARGRALVRDIGTVLRKVHSITTTTVFGDVLERERDQNGQPSRWLTFSGYVAAQLEEFSEQLRERDFAESERSDLAKTIADLRHELSSFHPRNPAVLNHGRFSLDHIWVEEDGREVTGLTGMERAVYLPAEADIAYFLWIEGIGRDDALVRSFYQGYGAARTMDVQRRERFYRRLVAFEALFGLKGEVPADREELIELTTSISL